MPHTFSFPFHRYNAFLKTIVEEWVKRISVLEEVISQWLSVQNLWMHLKSVFSGSDVARQLPVEAKRYSAIDRSWGKVMSNAAASPNCLYVCYKDASLREVLPWMNESLGTCQKYLASYLEKKRSAFPRFYFISDSKLLEILGQNSCAHVIPHLSSLFDNVDGAEVTGVDESVTTEMKDRISSILSKQKECMTLSTPIVAKGNAEKWLSNLEKEIHVTLRDKVVEALQTMDDISIEEAVARFPSQVTILCVLMTFTRNVEEALKTTPKGTLAKRKKTSLKVVLRQLQDTLRRLVNALSRMTSEAEDDEPHHEADEGPSVVDTLGLRSIVNNFPDEESKLQVPVNNLIVQATTIQTLVTIMIHHKDVLEELRAAGVSRKDDFEWLKQPRFYWKWSDMNCHVAVTDVELPYGYEYLGPHSRLAITPLTNRCYITLTQALAFCLGGAPIGPAGTGKTETVKDLGRMLGRFVVVFNCSDQMDFAQLGKIFKGLAESGAWGDFDEFNRINLDVLSVAAQQINCILNAIRQYRHECIFTDGSTIKVNHNCGVFITMNPGYAGRQELPANLQKLFRSVAMMVPDRCIILRVKLTVAGFHKADELSRKLSLLYELCESQLSKQAHYDFGLRNLLSIVNRLVTLKKEHPKVNEEKLLLDAVRQMNLSRLVVEDESLFHSMLQDLFPSTYAAKPLSEQSKSDESSKFTDGLLSYCKSNGYTLAPEWRRKVIELKETVSVRHGVMLLGPSASGKSSAIEAMAAAWGFATSSCVSVQRMNPKSMAAPDMFGVYDPKTQDWTEGVFSKLWKNVSKSASICNVAPQSQTSETGRSPSVFNWIVLDGPVDTLWIENLNSVLDDTRILTLANGDRLTMPENLKLLFEVEGLENASPATVSRAGMVYMDHTVLGWKCVVDKWLRCRISSIDTMKGNQDIHIKTSQRKRNKASNAKRMTAARDVHGEGSNRVNGEKRTLSGVDDCDMVEVSPDEAARLVKLLDSRLEQVVDYVENHLQGAIHSYQSQSINIVQSILAILEGLLIQRSQSRSKSTNSSNHGNQKRSLRSIHTDGSSRGAFMKRSPSLYKSTRDLSSAALNTITPESEEFGVDGIDRALLFAITWGLAAYAPSAGERYQLDRFLRAIFSDCAPPSSSGLVPIVDNIDWKREPRESKNEESSGSSSDEDEIFDEDVGSVLSAGRGKKNDPGKGKDKESQKQPFRGTLKVKPPGQPRPTHIRMRSAATDSTQPGRRQFSRQDDRTSNSHRRGQSDMTSLGDDHGKVKRKFEQDWGKPTVFDYFLDVEDDFRWKHWNGAVQPWAMSREWWRQKPNSRLSNVLTESFSNSFHSLFVSTPESTRALKLAHILHLQNRPTMFVGQTGIGKTFIVNRFLRMLKETDVDVESYSSISFSVDSNPASIQKGIRSQITKRVGQQYGPRRGGRLTMFLDDVHMPATNEWGDHPTSELLRQVVEHKLLYDLQNPGEPICVEDVSFIASRAPPSLHGAPGGVCKSGVPPRTQGRFALIQVDALSSDSIERIFNVILQTTVATNRGFSEDVVSIASLIPALMRRVWKGVHTELLPTPTKFHYFFSLRSCMDALFRVATVNPTSLKVGADLVLLWKHEMERTFKDRLVSDLDLGILQGAIESSVSKELDQRGVANQTQFLELLKEENPLYCDFYESAVHEIVVSEERKRAAAIATGSDEVPVDTVDEFRQLEFESTEGEMSYKSVESIPRLQILLQKVRIAKYSFGLLLLCIISLYVLNPTITLPTLFLFIFLS